MTLVALAGDPDNMPGRRDGKPQPRHAGKPMRPSGRQAGARRTAIVGAGQPPSSALVMASGPGLRLSWIVYRGKAAAVTFDPEQMKTWTDTRA